MAGTPFTDVDSADALLDELIDVLHSLGRSEHWKLNSEQALHLGRRAETAARLLFAFQVRNVGELDAQGAASARSVSSTAVLVREAFGISTREAGARVAAAKATLPQDLPSGGERPAVRPVLGAAITTGEINPESVGIVLRTLRRLPDDLPTDVIERAEQTLVDHAVVVDPGQLQKIADHLTVIVDPDGVEDLADKAKSKVEFHIGRRNSSTGLTSVNGWFDDLSIATITAVVEALSAPKPEVDGIKDPRPAPTRRAQALVEALEFTLHHGNDVLSTVGGVRPQVTVTLSWDAMTGRAANATLDTGTPMCAADLRRTLCDADLIPVVLGGPSGVLDVGRSRRLFTPAIRKALVARDRGCAFPGCERPPTYCEAHHINWWERDLGTTSLTNGVLLCAYHHAEIHRKDWRIILADDGTPEFIPPKWIDPGGTPRRNTVHHFHPFLAHTA